MDPVVVSKGERGRKVQAAPGELRALAASMNDVGVGIETIRAQLDLSMIDSAFAGSMLKRVGDEANSVVTDTWSRMAARWISITALIEASASALEAADVGFADRLDTLGGVL
ncbi:hypothetical protein [Nocardia bovistercoris]|uniref:Uncharacterized protein n=1 Tax=Nocardia bovistercoris TaxID=2785916 RepID=A0A931IF08_9NOCA|nr:hypothetical protein [Nocardia bovistercoris]MBH0778585.1 hypothetical protein [Nocardia bovistercoris]